MSTLPALNTPVIFGDGWKKPVDLACRRAWLWRVRGRRDGTGDSDEKTSFVLRLRSFPLPVGVKLARIEATCELRSVNRESRIAIEDANPY